LYLPPSSSSSFPPSLLSSPLPLSTPTDQQDSSARDDMAGMGTQTARDNPSTPSTKGHTNHTLTQWHRPSATYFQGGEIIIKQYQSHLGEQT
jgi:hypothetical protein